MRNAREEVLPGVPLTGDSSFHYRNAPDSGTYKIKVRVKNADGSAQAVTIDDLRLKKTTPRPRRQAPDATANATGLPITVAVGGSDSFRVRGSYELVSTDEGDKANLHLKALGEEWRAAPSSLGSTSTCADPASRTDAPNAYSGDLQATLSEH